MKINKPIQSGANKVHIPVESYIKGKRINFAKLLSDKGFTESLKYDVRAYNRRSKYHAEKQGLSIPETMKIADIKKQMKSGITSKEFRSIIKSISTGGYSKPRKDFDVPKTPPTTPGGKGSRGPRIDADYEQIKKEMIDRYGEGYFSKHEKLLKEYSKNLKKVAKEGIAGIDTDFSKNIEKFKQNLNKIERENILLKEVLKTKDLKQALGNIQKREVEAVNKRKEDKLRELLKENFYNNPIMQQKLNTLSLEEMRDIYNSDLKSVRAKDPFHKKYPHPNFFEPKIEKEDLVYDYVLTSIGGGSLRTSTYVDNYVRGLQTLSKDGVIAPNDKAEILSLLNLIPTDYLGDILLDDTIDMNEWYYDEDTISIDYSPTSRGKKILRGLKESMLNNLMTGNHTKWSKMYTPQELYDLQLRLQGD